MSVWLAAAAICLIFLSLQFREIGDALGPIVIVCALAGLIFGGVSFVLYGASWQSISGMLVCFPLVYLAGLELITRF
jgi:hypothetical protein